MYLTGGMRAIMCGSHLVRACVCDCLLVCSRATRGIGVPGISPSRRRTPQVHVGGQLPSASDLGGMRRVGGRCDHERPGPRVTSPGGFTQGLWCSGGCRADTCTHDNKAGSWRHGRRIAGVFRSWLGHVILATTRSAYCAFCPDATSSRCCLTSFFTSLAIDLLSKSVTSRAEELASVGPRRVGVNVANLACGNRVRSAWFRSSP